jgi:hypothetical protein
MNLGSAANSSWTKLKDNWSIIGAKRFITTASNWALTKEFNVFCLNLEKFNTEGSQRAGFKLTEMRDDDVPLLLDINPGLTREKIETRLKGGQKCYIGWLEDEPVIFMWYGCEIMELEFLGLRMSLLPGDIAFTDTYVIEKMRKRGIYQAAVRMSAAHFKALGFKRRFGFGASWHYPTNHMLMDILKYELMGSVTYRPMMPFNKYKLNGALRLDDQGRLVVTHAEGS